MPLTRIVAELDYDHGGTNADVEPIVLNLFDRLSDFANAYQGMKLVVMSFVEAYDEAEAPLDRTGRGT